MNALNEIIKDMMGLRYPSCLNPPHYFIQGVYWSPLLLVPWKLFNASYKDHFDLSCACQNNLKRHSSIFLFHWSYPKVISYLLIPKSILSNSSINPSYMCISATSIIPILQLLVSLLPTFSSMQNSRYNCHPIKIHSLIQVVLNDTGVRIEPLSE